MLALLRSLVATRSHGSLADTLARRQARKVSQRSRIVVPQAPKGLGESTDDVACAWCAVHDADGLDIPCPHAAHDSDENWLDGVFA